MTLSRRTFNGSILAAAAAGLPFSAGAQAAGKITMYLGPSV